MAIQTRRGLEADYDSSKLLPGEWAVSTDTRYVRMCFAPGVVYRMATYESFEEDMIQIQQILATCEDIQTAVEAFEALAEQHANDAAESATASANSATASANSATLSKSWAVGGTGARPGEDTNSAEYWAGVAQAVADIHIATNDTVGIVKGNEGEINIDIGGQMSIPSDFTPQTTLEAVMGTEDKKTFFGKVAKVITDFMAHAANTSIHFGLTNNLLAAESGTALDAVQGKALDTKVTANTADIAALNSKLFYQSVDFSRFKSNLLSFDSSGLYAEENKTVRFASTASNAPISDSTFKGLWKLNWFGSNEVMAELIEFSPVAGRRWTNYCLNSNWSGWKSVTPL